MTAERPNYYLLLELDTSVDDWTAIEARLQEHKQRWSKQSVMGAPAAARKAKHNLGLLGKITEVLKNPETRREEARDAVRRIEQERQQKFQELDEHLDLLRASGGYSDADLAALVKQLASRLTDKEIEERARTKGLVRKVATSVESVNARPKLDASSMEKIREALRFLKIADLYAFLSLTSQSPARSLRERADQMNREVLSIGKTDSESQAKKDLCGQCMAVFRDEEQRKRYDNSLVVEAMQGLLPQIETAGRDSLIAQEELDLLVRWAMERRVQPADAISFIEEHARTRKWVIARVGTSLPVQALPQCGYCLTVAEQADAARCRKCGEALKPPCPSCGQATPSLDQACRQCGTVIADAPLVKELMREGQKLELQGDFFGALKQYQHALVFWPRYQLAQVAQKNARQRQTQQEEALGSIEQLLKAQRLREARGAIERFTRAFGPAGSEALSSRIDTGLTHAETALREGRDYQRAGQHAAAIARFEEAARLCVDFEAARDALAACPPAAPTELRLSLLREGVRLDWSTVSGSATLRYRVVRQVRVRPTSPDDGVTLAEVSVPRWDDITAVSGTPYYYAVYCARGEVFSRDGATGGPWLHTPDVADLEAMTGNGSVTLRWRAPKGCCRVEVYRHAGSEPKLRGEGVSLTITGDHAHDHALPNGVSVSYLVVAVYDDPTHPGQEYATPGVRVSALPQAPPQPVTDLLCERTDRRVELRWSVPTGPPGTTVQIRRSHVSPSQAPGQGVSIHQLSRIGSVVPTTTSTTAHVTLDTQGQVVFVPISLCNTSAVLGRSITVTTIDEVRELKAASNGTDISLSWTWPVGVEEVRVCHAVGGYPESPTQQGQLVSRQAYQRSSGFVLRLGKRDRYYLTVFAKSGEAFSTGARIFEGMGQEPKVSYHVVVKKALFTRAVTEVSLELLPSEPLDMPGMVLLAKENSLPVSPQDGQVIARIQAAPMATRTTVKIPKEHWNVKRFVKLFFADASVAREVRLLPATTEQLRLG